jgi:ribonuclease HI
VIKIYTDGSCKPTNPGPAGYGVVVIIDDNTISTANKYIGEATNNVAEIMGLQHALELLRQTNSQWEEVTVYTDSQYVIGIFQKNWNAKANQVLIAEVKRELENFPNLTFEWVKAHNGDKYNEMADKLAKGIVDATLESKNGKA